MKFIESLNRLEPFGLDNEKPLFWLSLNKIKASAMPKFPAHIKFMYNKINFVGFNYGEQLDMFNSGCNKQLLVDLGVDEYYSKSHIKAYIKGIKMGRVEEAPKRDILANNYLKQLEFLETKGSATPKQISLKNEKTELSSLLDNTYYGTLVIANTFESYNEFLRYNIGNVSNFEIFDLTNATGVNTLILSPKTLPNLTNYNNVVFLDRVLCNGYLNSISNSYKINIYCVQNHNNEVFKALSCNRQTFATYHNAIVNSIIQEVKADNSEDYFFLVRKLHPQLKTLTLSQYTFVPMVLTQLGILSFENGAYKINKDIHSQLHNSSIYRYIEEELCGRG